MVFKDDQGNKMPSGDGCVTALATARQAVWDSLSEETVRKFVAAGGDVNERGQDGMTLLFNACRFQRNPMVVSMLLKAGADPNGRIPRYDGGFPALGPTPLMAAA